MHEIRYNQYAAKKLSKNIKWPTEVRIGFGHFQSSNFFWTPIHTSASSSFATIKNAKLSKSQFRIRHRTAERSGRPGAKAGQSLQTPQFLFDSLLWTHMSPIVSVCAHKKRSDLNFSPGHPFAWNLQLQLHCALPPHCKTEVLRKFSSVGSICIK